MLNPSWCFKQTLLLKFSRLTGRLFYFFHMFAVHLFAGIPGFLQKFHFLSTLWRFFLVFWKVVNKNCVQHWKTVPFLWFLCLMRGENIPHLTWKVLQQNHTNNYIFIYLIKMFKNVLHSFDRSLHVGEKKKITKRWGPTHSPFFQIHIWTFLCGSDDSSAQQLCP